MNVLKRICFGIAGLSCFICGTLIWAEDAPFTVYVAASVGLFVGGIMAAHKAMGDGE